MFDANEYRGALARNDNYIGKQSFPFDSFEWRTAKNGHSVFDKEEEEPFKAIMVGNIADFRLNVGPTGNYINAQYGPLSKAKFQFHLTTPIGPPFREDYSRAYQLLKRFQDNVAATTKRNDMLFETSGARTIRMTRSVFEKRLIPANDSPPHDGEDVVEIDAETKNWVVPTELQDELEIMKPSYRAVPLHVYNNGTFVEPVDVPHQMENALVEVTFTINHAFIKRAQEAHDSFQAEIEQVIIIRKRPIVKNNANDPRAGPAVTRKRKREGEDNKSGESSGHKGKQPEKPTAQAGASQA